METLRRKFLVTVSLFMLMVTFLFVPTITGRADTTEPVEPTKTPPTEWTEQPTLNATILDVTQASCDICSKEDLYGLNIWIKNNSNTNLVINLKADIVVNEGVIKANTSVDHLWTPIDVEAIHTVILNGEGHTISGLYCDDSTKSNVGFFGACEGFVQVSKLGIVNSYFNGSSNVGAFAGTLGDGSIISECYSQSIVAASDKSAVGGIVAVLQGDARVSSCYNTGDIACVPDDYKMNVANSCYMASISGLDAYDGTGSVALTEDEFKSGAAAYVLSGGCSAEGVNLDTAWGQKLTPSYDSNETATTNKSYPVFSSDKVTFGKANCKADTAETYINADEVKLHYHGSIVRHVAKAATCTESGNEEYYICTDCNAVVEADGEGIFTVVNGALETDYRTEATGHQHYNEILAGSKVITNEDGTTSHGHILHYICKECGIYDDSKDKVINAEEMLLITTEGVACTGVTTVRYCAECGYNEKILGEATGHTYVTYCTEGYHWTICTGCKEIKSAKEEHKLITTIEAVAATCEKDGKTAQIECESCGRVMSTSQVVKATGHRYGDWEVTIEASCENAGEEQRVCILCDGKDIKSIEALGHDKKTTQAKAATCTEEGNETYSICSRCDKIFDAQDKELEAIPILAKKEHVLQTIPGKKATCTEDGLEDGQQCIACNHEEGKEILPAGHEEVTDAAVAATCTQAGKSEGSHCSVCNEILTAQEIIPALNHIVDGVSQLIDVPEVKATCMAAGTTAGKKCTLCNTITEGCEVSEKLSHKYDLTKADVAWNYDSETNKITATATITCEYECGTSIADIPCTVTTVKNLDGTLKVSGIFSYKGQTETREFNITLKDIKWTQTDTGFNVCYIYENAEKNIEIVVTSEALGTISKEDIIYTAASVVDNITLDTVTHTFNKATAQYSWTKTTDGYSFIATVNGKTQDDGTLRLVQKATPKDVTNEAGEVVSTIYNATITVGGTELKSGEKTVVNVSYTITLQGNATFVNSSETSISASYLQLVTVTCGKEEGKVFAGWYINDELVSSKETYSFYVKDSIVLEARFSEQAVEAQAVVSFSVGNRVDLENGKQTIAVVVDWEIPDGCTLVEAGFRRIYIEEDSSNDNAADAENILKEKGENVKEIVSSLKTNAGTLTSTLTLSATTKVKNMYTIAYITYTDKNGQQQTLYSKCITSSCSVNS